MMLDAAGFILPGKHSIRCSGSILGNPPPGDLQACGNRRHHGWLFSCRADKAPPARIPGIVQRQNHSGTVERSPRYL